MGFVTTRFAGSFQFGVPSFLEFGPGKRATLPVHAEELGMKRVFFVTDDFLAKTDYVQETIAAIEDRGIRAELWDGSVPNPTDVSIDEGAQRYKEAGCDGVIGWGGGSAMDTAKSIAILACSDATSIREHMAPISRPVQGIAPLIVVSTTSGTGAEMAYWAIVTNTETNEKGSGYPASRRYTQKVSIVDPELTISMPPMLTAVTGMDALCHAIEGYTTNRMNPMMNAFQQYAIEMVALYLRRAVYNGQDLEARTGMSLAAMLAGISMGRGLPHALNLILIAKYHISHGLACAVNLVAGLEFILPAKIERLSKVARMFGVFPEGRSERELAEAAIAEIRQLLEDVGIPSLHEATGATDDDIPDLLERLWKNRGQLPWKPPLARPLSEEDIITCFKRSLSL